MLPRQIDQKHKLHSRSRGRPATPSNGGLMEAPKTLSTSVAYGNCFRMLFLFIWFGMSARWCGPSCISLATEDQPLSRMNNTPTDIGYRPCEPVSKRSEATVLTWFAGWNTQTCSIFLN